MNLIHIFCAQKPIEFITNLFVGNSLNLNRLRNLDAEHRSDSESRRNGAIDGTSDVYKLLRAAAHDMNSCHRQRFILLVIRGNRDDADIDTLYVYRPAVAKEIAPEHVSDHVELSYLVNSKAPIVEGLPSDSEGVLGLCHHLHAEGISFWKICNFDILYFERERVSLYTVRTQHGDMM